MILVGTLLLVVFVISAVLLILIVLVQDDQGEGVGGLFGGGSSTPFGSRSGNVLTRFTGILATLFIVCSFALAWINRSADMGDVEGAARRSQETTEWWSQAPAETQTDSAATTPAPANSSSAQ